MLRSRRELHSGKLFCAHSTHTPTYFRPWCFPVTLLRFMTSVEAGAESSWVQFGSPLESPFYLYQINFSAEALLFWRITLLITIDIHSQGLETKAGEWKKIQSILIPIPLLLQILIPILIPIPQKPNIHSHSKHIHTYGKKVEFPFQFL